MPRIAVTGAAGNVGQQALQAFDDEEVTPITHHEHDDLDSIVLNTSDADTFCDALAGQDVLVIWPPIHRLPPNGTQLSP